MIYFISLVSLTFAMLVYFRLAIRYGIIDHPNERSSHQSVTIRGGGIIFFLSILLFFILSQFAYKDFFIGISLLTIIYLIEDLRNLPIIFRISAQVIALLFLFQQLRILQGKWYLEIAGLLVAIGFMNGYNFMDGINGLTAGFSLINLTFFWYLNCTLGFINQELVSIVLISVLIFSFFNFRGHAKCFAGDVGSMVMSFILIFITLKLILFDHDFIFILFYLVYGLDIVLTIAKRLINKENIFKAHRSHLYQYLANEMNWGHLKVAVLYSAIQIVVNISVLYLSHSSKTTKISGSMIIITVLFLSYTLSKQFVLNLMKNEFSKTE